MNKVAVKKPTNAYASLAGVLGEGFGDLMAEGDQYAEVPLDDITVKPQVREEFEDEENSMADMTASVRKHGVFQPILIRPVAGGPLPYELVAGERRYIASRNAEKKAIPAIIRKMTDEEATLVQLAENIQRKNLTQIEEAKRIQKDLDELGSVDAVLEKHNKGRAWLSKILSLLKLPEQAKRLISEKVSADLEVINAVKTIEKHDPAKAKKLVDTLKETRGKEDARKQVAKVKDEVKPPSAKKAAAKAAEQGGTVATAKGRSAEQPGEAQVFSGARKPGANDSQRPPVVFTPAQALSSAYTRIFEHGDSPKKIFDAMKADDKATVEDWLRTYYEAGTKAKDVGRAVVQAFRKGQFSTDGEGAFALVAFLNGTDGDAKFNLLNILGSVKE